MPDIAANGDRSWFLNSNSNGDFELVPTGGKWEDRTYLKGSNGDMYVGGNIYFDGGDVKNLLDKIAKLEAKVKALEKKVK